MELLPLLRLIKRRRLLLGIGLVVAVALAVAIGGPPASSGAVAWTRVALDTPTSQLVKSAPAGADTLTWRASLLVHLMNTDEAQRQLARRLGIPPDQIMVVDPGLATPEIPASLPTAASDAAAMTVAPYVLTVLMPRIDLPLIAIEASGPDRAGAERLATAAAGILESQSSLSGARYESMIKTGGATATLERFLLEQVAPVRSKPVSASVLPIKQIGGPTVLLVLWTAGVLLLPLILDRRRRGPALAGA
jgi:hypothetical protein